MALPVKLYKPRKRADRWWLRADVNVAGERIELWANASSTLAKRATNWFNRMASKLAGQIDNASGELLGAGVFGDVPHVATSIGQSRVVPVNHDVTMAADLYRRLQAGEPRAHEHMWLLQQMAPRDPLAAQALQDVDLVGLATFERHRLPMQRVFLDAAEGSPHAQKLLAALHQTAPAQEPVRVQWWIDDYERAPHQMTHDIIMATGDEIGARLVRPARTPRVRLVKPGNEQAMLHTFREILRRNS